MEELRASGLEWAWTSQTTAPRCAGQPLADAPQPVWQLLERRQCAAR